MPNQIAFLALGASPILVAVLMARLPMERAIVWSVLICYLFLPEHPAAFDLPMLPVLTKHNIPALVAFAIAIYRYGTGGAILPRALLPRMLLLGMVLSPLATALTNAEPILFQRAMLPGLGIKDAVSLMIEQMLLVVPFLLAHNFLASGGSQRELLRAFMIGGLIYSPFLFIEMRLSPQLNNWVYGYYQHLFSQTIRAGGYRPIVFLIHGLVVAFFLMTAVVAAFALWRHGESRRPVLMLGAAIYLGIVLVMMKSLGALVFAIFLVPLVLLLKPMTQVRIAMLLGALALAYPIMKGTDLVPQDFLLQQAAKIDEERAESLRFRLVNEDALLERAYEKPIFGWGSWGRNHIHNPVDGTILSITDGTWIVVLGSFGWVGFLAQFGLLVIPLFMIWRVMRQRGAADVSPLVGPLCLLHAINMVDLLPNASMTPLTWLVAGALAGYAERLRRDQPAQVQRPVRPQTIM